MVCSSSPIIWAAKYARPTSASTGLPRSPSFPAKPKIPCLPACPHRSTSGCPTEMKPWTCRPASPSPRAPPTPWLVWPIPSRNIWAVQFHPEVRHTPRGTDLLRNFLFNICHAQPNWTPAHFIQSTVSAIREQVGEGRAICALSGGVDSSVAAVLVERAIGDRLTCVFVNNGVLRKNEFLQVQQNMRDRLGLRLVAVDASDRFLSRLAGVLDPSKSARSSATNSSPSSTTKRCAFWTNSSRERRRLAGPGHSLSRCDRVFLRQRPIPDHQEPPQCGRPAGKHEVEVDRAATRFVQG